MTLQEVIETRHRYYLEMQVKALLLLNEDQPLTEGQWHSLHYMQFWLLLSAEEYPHIPQGL